MVGEEEEEGENERMREKRNCFPENHSPQKLSKSKHYSVQRKVSTQYLCLFPKKASCACACVHAHLYIVNYMCIICLFSHLHKICSMYFFIYTLAFSHIDTQHLERIA